MHAECPTWLWSPFFCVNYVLRDWLDILYRMQCNWSDTRKSNYFSLRNSYEHVVIIVLGCHDRNYYYYPKNYAYIHLTFYLARLPNHKNKKIKSNDAVLSVHLCSSWTKHFVDKNSIRSGESVSNVRWFDSFFNN